MPKDYEIEGLLKKHEELVNLYVHQNKIEWNLITVYVAFNMGLAGAVASLFREEYMRAIAFLCFLGFLFGLGGFILFGRHQKYTSGWISEGKKVEKVLNEKAITVELFQTCEELRRKTQGGPKIRSGMLALTVVWLIATIWTFMLATG